MARVRSLLKSISTSSMFYLLIIFLYDQNAAMRYLLIPTVFYSYFSFQYQNPLIEKHQNHKTFVCFY